MIAASQGASSWIDPSEVITPRRHEEVESPISIQRQQPVTESPISVQRQQPAIESPISIQRRSEEVESPISIQRQRTTPESQLAVTQTVTQAEPETPVAGSSSGPAGSNSREIWYPCSECLAVLTSASSLRFHIMAKHRPQVTSPPVLVREGQNEAPVTERREAEVVTLSSPTKRIRTTSPGTA